jgi:hypothetical protein
LVKKIIFGKAPEHIRPHIWVEVVMKKYFLLFGACIVFGSCSTGEGAIATLLLGNSSQAPVFLNCRIVSENEIEFEFSRPVKVTSLKFEPYLSVISIENGSTVRVKMEKSNEPGKMFTADLLAEDEHRNTINVLIPLRSRNNRIPALVINEVRTDYSNPRVEFIELKMKTAGNLGAMRVFFAGGSQKPTIYEFSPVEVKQNEFVVLHLRKREEDCRDEYGSNLAESGGTGSSPDARDFWVPGTVKLINKTGFVYVMDQDDRVLDAVMFSEKPDPWWTKDYLAEAAEFLYSKGAWKSVDGKVCSPATAVSSLGTTATRTINRNENTGNTNTPADWYITVTSGATPGKPNNPNRFAN